MSLAGNVTTGDGADGFTLVEILMVVALIAILGGMVIPVSAGMIARAKADSTGVEVLTWLEAARNRSNSERRNFEVTFDTSANRILITRVESDLTKTTILDRELPDGMKFLQVSGAPDTPDLFGNGTVVKFDGPGPHMFATDGSFIDANGDPNNGTIFMGKPGQAGTAGAITFFGTTGLLRSWKLTGHTWYQ